MHLFGGFARDGSALRRARLTIALAVAVLALLAAERSPAARLQIKASHQEAYQYVGHDWPGKVSLVYTGSFGDRGAGVFGIYSFRFANLCSRRGSHLKDTITIRVGKDKLFSYHGHGFTVSGNVIGRIASPREIAGVASVSTHGCSSGPWWFGVRPAHH